MRYIGWFRVIFCDVGSASGVPLLVFTTHDALPNINPQPLPHTINHEIHRKPDIHNLYPSSSIGTFTDYAGLHLTILLYLTSKVAEHIPSLTPTTTSLWAESKSSRYSASCLPIFYLVVAE